MGTHKYPCFLSHWDSRANDKDYVRQEWPLRQELKPASNNVQSHPLVEPNKILLPLLHTKLGVMKNFVKAMDREGMGFTFLQERFPLINMEKLTARIFDRPQIREFTKDPMFDKVLGKAERDAVTASTGGSPWKYLSTLGLVGRVFTYGSGDRSSIQGRVIPQKMILDTSLLNTQYYKLWIKGKVEQSKERGSTLSYTSV